MHQTTQTAVIASSSSASRLVGVISGDHNAGHHSVHNERWVDDAFLFIVVTMRAPACVRSLMGGWVALRPERKRRGGYDRQRERERDGERDGPCKGSSSSTVAALPGDGRESVRSGEAAVAV